MKSPKPRNKAAQRKVHYKNYDAITMRKNYEEKLLQEIRGGFSILVRGWQRASQGGKFYRRVATINRQTYKHRADI